ncbi:MAG: dihydrolipoyl dehydrogenase family protein [Candidatus Methylacidiphilales bacterium]
MSSAVPSYDFVVVGAGSAGYAAARTAVGLGLKTAVVDGARHLGGLCILRGCMPTKALLESAHRLHQARRASEFGLRLKGSIEPHWKKVVHRKNILIEDFASYRRDQLHAGNFDFFHATASFVDAHTLALTPVEAKNKNKVPGTLTLRTALIATGSKISLPSVEGLGDVEALTSDNAIHLTRPPQSLIVLGGGPIAVEFADYFHCMGVRVTLIQRSPHILKSMDEEVSAEVENAFRHDGMTVFTGTELQAVGKKKNKKWVRFLHGGEVKEIKADQILNGLGREPMTDGLGLEPFHLKRRARALAANLHMQTSLPHLFAAGDVCGPHEVVHVAIQQGETAARNAAALIRGEKKLPSRMDYRVPMEIVFSDPEVASVGLTERAAKQEGYEVLSASYPFNDHGKSIIMGAKFGFVKCVADATNGRILGAQIVGPHASDLIHEFSVAITLRCTVETFLKVPHYHPTLAEIVTYPVEEIAEARSQRVSPTANAK